jgi:arylsulfatase
MDTPTKGTRGRFVPMTVSPSPSLQTSAPPPLPMSLRLLPVSFACVLVLATACGDEDAPGPTVPAPAAHPQPLGGSPAPAADRPNPSGPAAGSAGPGPRGGHPQLGPGGAPGAGHQGGGGGAAFHTEPTFDLVGGVENNPRSIVLISLDTVRADRLAAYGGRAESPVISGLATKGARFNQAISHFPETCLSHWSMISGVPPEAHGNAPAHRGSLSTVPTVPEIAGEHGYATAAFIGGETLTDRSCGFGRGFDIIDDRFPLNRADMKRPGAEVSRKAARWIRAQTGPYVAFVHYFDAHFPYTPAAPWDTRYDPDYKGTINGTDEVLRPYRDGQKTPTERDVAHVLALYDGELSELDALLAPVVKAAGPGAVILVTSDHGESFGHDYWFNHRAGLWDDILHVPLVVRGPGVPAGAVVDTQVGLVDIAPTLLELAGLPLDRRIAGVSLVPLLRGEGEGRAVVHATTDPWMGSVQRATRTLHRKVIIREDGSLVYDLDADPAELRALGASVDRDAAGAAYAAHLSPFLTLRADPPVPLGQTPEEAARLEALGYQVPGNGPPPGNGPVPEKEPPPPRP